MSADLLPNAAGPVQRAMAAEYAARRARLFNGPPPPKAIVRPRPLSPFDPRRLEEVIATAVAENPPAPIPPWKAILTQVSEKHGIPVAVIVGNSRARSILPARYEAAYRMVTELGMSLPATGRRLNRDHTTIIHAIARHLEAHPELVPEAVRKATEEKSVREQIEREVVRLYFEEEKTPTAISRALDVSRNVVHCLVRREVMRVRKLERSAA